MKISDYKKDYYDNISLYKSNDFLNYKNKESFEKGIIFMSMKKFKEMWERDFLNKYHIYLENNIRKDIRIVLNNNYCFYIFMNLLNISSEDKYLKTIFLKNIMLKDVDRAIEDKYISLINGLIKGFNMDNQDKEFIKRCFHFEVFNDGIYKNSGDSLVRASDVVSYFKKYPFNDINTSNNRFFYIINEVCKRMINIEGNNCFKFINEKSNDMGNHYEENGVSNFEIYDFDVDELDSEYIFVKKCYACFHEITHIKQGSNCKDYDLKIKNRFEIEKEIIDKDPKFYEKYHDSFFCEKDARYRGCLEVIKQLGNKYPVLVKRLVGKIRSFETIEANEFKIMENQEYNRIKSLPSRRRKNG